MTLGMTTLRIILVAALALISALPLFAQQQRPMPYRIAETGKTYRSLSDAVNGNIALVVVAQHRSQPADPVELVLVRAVPVRLDRAQRLHCKVDEIFGKVTLFHSRNSIIRSSPRTHVASRSATSISRHRP